MENQFYIFGAGKNGRRLLKLLNDNGIRVAAFIDNDRDKQNEGVGTLECISVEEAVKRGAKTAVILLSPEDDEQIKKQLKREGFQKLVGISRWMDWMGKKMYFEPAVLKMTDYNHVVPFNHYESPYPDIREIHQKEKEVFDKEKEILDIDFNVDRQIELFGQMKDISMPGWANEKSTALSDRYYYDNEWFGKGSADALYYMMRILKPRNIIEVGSGFSTAVMLDTNDKFMEGSVTITSVEPNAQRLRSLLGPKDRIEIYEKNLQEIEVTFFEKLTKNDILFIDSSHVAKTNADVNYILFEILPRLRNGVYIHFHDIFWPFIYPKEWVYEGRAYNEAFMLRAFLMNNRSYTVQLFGEMFASEHLRVYKNKIAKHLWGCGSGSLWIKKEVQTK